MRQEKRDELKSNSVVAYGNKKNLQNPGKFK